MPTARKQSKKKAPTRKKVPKPTAEEVKRASAAAARFSAQIQRFCDEYLALGESNGAEAARRARYSLKRAKVQASNLLARPDVQEYLSAKRAPVLRALTEEHKINLEHTLQEAAAIAYSDIGDVTELEGGQFKIKDFKRMTPAARRTIAAITISPGMFGNKISLKLWDKGTAQDRVTKMLNLTPPDEEEMTHAERAERLATILENGARRKAERLAAEASSK